MLRIIARPVIYQVVGGVMAIEVARSAKERGMKLHYPLLVASGYSGFVIWHMGYSGSGPLNAATEGGAYSDLPGELTTAAHPPPGASRDGLPVRRTVVCTRPRDR